MAAAAAFPAGASLLFAASVFGFLAAKYLSLPINKKLEPVNVVSETWKDRPKANMVKWMMQRSGMTPKALAEYFGYSENYFNIDKRLQQLNRSECIPYAIRVYATYEVNSRLSDPKIHSITDKLNPNLRSIENFNGKQRMREFYAMSPEDAYSILEAIAEIHGRVDKLKRIAMDEARRKTEETAQEIDAEHRERLAPFTIPLTSPTRSFKGLCTVWALFLLRVGKSYARS